MRANKKGEIIAKALKVFYSSGFHATGMDTLVREIGISKTSIYKHFSSKEDLIAAVLTLRDDNFRTWLFERMARDCADPQAQILTMFEALDEWFSSDEFRGCMFINAAAEFPDAQDPIRSQVADHKEQVRAHLENLLTEAGHAHPEPLSRKLALLKEGAITAAYLTGNPNAAQEAAEIAKVLLRPLSS